MGTWAVPVKLRLKAPEGLPKDSRKVLRCANFACTVKMAFPSMIDYDALLSDVIAKLGDQNTAEQRREIYSRGHELVSKRVREIDSSALRREIAAFEAACHRIEASLNIPAQRKRSARNPHRRPDEQTASSQSRYSAGHKLQTRKGRNYLRTRIIGIVLLFKIKVQNTAISLPFFRVGGAKSIKAAFFGVPSDPHKRGSK
jgi:hypothetical protein